MRLGSTPGSSSQDSKGTVDVDAEGGVGDRAKLVGLAGYLGSEPAPKELPAGSSGGGIGDFCRMRLHSEAGKLGPSQPRAGDSHSR